ncbi:MAG: Amuc_1099 family pilus-like system protein [bacterium]
MTTSGIKAFFRKNYDRLIAAVVLVVLLSSLVFLAVQAKIQKAGQQEFDGKLARLTPKFEKADAADKTIFNNALEAIAGPFQTEEWKAGLLLTPELRVRCVGCDRPIPYTATNCTFKACGVEQPPDKTSVVDSNGNGVPDEWEKKFNLFAMSGDELSVDHDNDGFSSREEYDWKTDPRDPGSHPPYLAKVRVASIKPIPFRMIFKAVNRAGGKLIFQINLRLNGRSFYKSLGEEAEGFKLVSYDEKAAEGPTLTLERNGKLIPLIKGHQVPRDDYEVKLVSLMDGTVLTVRPDVDFEFKNAQYRVKKVDIGTGRVLINDPLRNVEVWIERQAPGVDQPSATSNLK